MNKELTLKAMTLFAIAIVSCAHSTEPSQADLQELYDKWHSAVAANGLLVESMLFDTDYGDRALTAAVLGMREHRFAMAEFLCEKYAAQSALSYKDAILLRRLAGIDLLRPDSATPGQNFRENISGCNLRNSRRNGNREYIGIQPSALPLCVGSGR